jgi:hypothetical protein
MMYSERTGKYFQKNSGKTDVRARNQPDSSLFLLTN